MSPRRRGTESELKQPSEFGGRGTLPPSPYQRELREAFRTKDDSAEAPVGTRMQRVQ